MMGYIYSDRSHPVVQRYQSQAGAMQHLLASGKQGWYAYIENGEVIATDVSYMALAHRYWEQPGFSRKSIFRIMAPIT